MLRGEEKSIALRVKFNLTLGAIPPLDKRVSAGGQLRSTCFRGYVAAGFQRSGVEGGQHTRGGHDRVTATRDCGPVLTQLAKWPLQIESRPPATDIEQRDEREREREREKKKKEVNVRDITTRGVVSKRNEGRGGGRETEIVSPEHRIPNSLRRFQISAKFNVVRSLKECEKVSRRCIAPSDRRRAVKLMRRMRERSQLEDRN